MRGLRNNNPLNIRRSTDRWDGATTTQTDKDFVQFQSMAYGYRAAWRILNTYYKKLKERKKHFTVENIIHRWAPPCENDTQAYIGTVLRLTGLGGKENLVSPLEPQGVWKLSSIIAAMTVVENGIKPEEVDIIAIKRGYYLAFHSDYPDESERPNPEEDIVWDEYWDWSPEAYGI